MIKQRFFERHIRADERARKTKSLPRRNKVHRILFGIPIIKFVRNIPRHLRTLRVRESLKVFFFYFSTVI